MTINREILRLAIPNIISNISIPLLSTVDIFLMGNLSVNHLGAIGVGTMIFNLIYWNFGFLRMGTTGLTAQAYGRKNNREIALIFYRAAGLAFTLALLLVLFQGPIYEISSYLMNVSENQNQIVRDYYLIRLIAAPATLLLYAVMGWYFGMQNVLLPLVITIVANLINILISYLLVHHYEMGISGVAYGTVVAQYSGLLIGIFYMAYRYRTVLKSVIMSELFRLNELIKFLNVNKDLFVRTVGLTTVFFFIYSQSAKGGELILGANVVLLLFLNWMSYGIDGFAYAAESLVGKYVGAQDKNRLSSTIQYCIIWGAGLAIAYSLVYGLAGDWLLSKFSNDSAVISLSGDYLWWMILLPIGGFLCYIWDGIFIGFTASKAMRNSMLVSFALFLVCYYLAGGIDRSNHILWLALTLFLIARGVIQTWQYYRYKDLWFRTI